MISSPIWFWTDIVSPHFVGLYTALMQRGVSVHVVVEASGTSEDRSKLGWPSSYSHVPSTALTDRSEVGPLLERAPADAIHICSRLDFRLISGRARELLTKARRPHWAVMETVEDRGMIGPAKRLKYRSLIFRTRRSVKGIFAIGGRTRDWLIDRGADPSKVFSFAYFLDQPTFLTVPPRGRVRLCYVGQLIRRKRVDLLIEALAISRLDATLLIVGAGPEEARLRALARKLPPGSVEFRSAVPHSEVPAILAAADYLVLPSEFEGWGAVAVEALMMGTSVICTDRCGSAEVAAASGAGLIFRANDLSDLIRCLRFASAAGSPPSDLRKKIADWATCLSGSSGADYLMEILAGKVDGETAVTPWRRNPRPRTATPRASTLGMIRAGTPPI